MFFKQVSFVISTTNAPEGKKANKADAIQTNVTLLECEVPDDVVASALVSGQSPRVGWQQRAKANGIPRSEEILWSDWIKPGRVSVQKALTKDELKMQALGNADIMAELVAKVRADILAEQGEKEQE